MLERILEPEAMDTAEEAADYDAMDHSGPNADFIDRLIELGARGRMLDIGTGPGQMPPVVAARVPDAHVLGIDLAHEMLAVAERRRLALDASVRDRIEYRAADAKRLDLPDAHFDAVFSNTILHHIPEPAAFLREARRVLAPGGVLLIRDLFRPKDLETLNALVALHAANCNESQRKLFAESLHAALTPQELRVLADECGLGHAELVVDTDRHMSLQLRAH
ncbi:MAG: methyltransferase domain-containing protein [Planctomycetes bacterium]|nr:methyltransferase domain-containing protein [Planctomycetota bacterium]MCB9904568.1 methyltransferase domain-containing protein [Planctomycetota bacterium]